MTGFKLQVTETTTGQNKVEYVEGTYTTLVFGVQTCDAESLCAAWEDLEGIPPTAIATPDWSPPPSCAISWYSIEYSVDASSRIACGYLQDGLKRYELMVCPSIVVSVEGGLLDPSDIIKTILRQYSTTLYMCCVCESQAAMIFYVHPLGFELLRGRVVRVKGQNCRIEPNHSHSNMHHRASHRCAQSTVTMLPPSLPAAVCHDSNPSASPSPSPSSSSSIKYFIEIFHDAENCTCVGSASGNEVYNRTVGAILCGLLGSKEAASRVDMIAEVSVTWSLVTSMERQNQYNTPSSALLSELRRHGVVCIDAGPKLDAVDNVIKALLRRYEMSYGDMSSEDKDRRVAVLLSGDSDFAGDIRSIRMRGLKVMLVHNHSSTSEAFLNQVPPGHRLGRWCDVSGLSPPVVSSPPSPPSPPQLRLPSPLSLPSPCESRRPINNTNVIYQLAEFILVRADPAGGASMEATKVSEMYPRSTAFRGAVESAGGLKKYCGTTNGSIEFVDNTRGGMVRVNAYALARVFVESRGGRVTASEFGKFYDHLGEARLTMKALVGKVKTALCANHGAGLVWEDEDDKEIGFGYIRCVTPPTSSCTLSP